MSTKLNITLITENLADELIVRMQNAAGIYMMTSFIMQSGVRLLAPHLKQAIDRGAEVKVLAGDYLFVTQPEGLQALRSIDPRLEARLWRSMGTSFHPKAYLFDFDNGEGYLIVGSSNFSMSAMKMGMEWNLSMNAKAEPYTFQVALDKFMENFYHESTLPLNEETIALYEQEYRDCHRNNPELNRLITEMEEDEYHIDGLGTAVVDEHEQELSVTIQPRFAQIDALDALERTVEEEYDKAMVVMATGLGKTYLAGFFAQRFQRVLFIAHREEILLQAQRSFQRIMPDKTVGIYNGILKEGAADCVFASIYTLGMKRHRESFAPEHFDLIVIDEFHHAAANSYQSVIRYFKPSFLLGITATPDRMDGKDVYAVCAGNVAYQIHFLEAIRRGWLSPFQYYGVYDDTDYSAIRWMGSHYDDEQLTAAQLRDAMLANVFDAWSRHKQSRSLGFCSSVRQADALSAYFQKCGVAAISLHSRTKDISREEAIRQLADGRLDIIFTVDLFNEGVDIPSVDTLLFVRPTESLTIFTQQVGRGLRLSAEKTHCTIIDLIGNYRNADVKLRLFGSTEEDRDTKNKADQLPSLPAGCAMILDTAVVNLLNELQRKKLPRREQMQRAFLDLKSELGRIPSYMELHLHGSTESKGYKQEFGSYVGFLHWANMLSAEEAAIFEQHETWLRDAEKTVMSKSYKMVVLLAMLERGVERWFEPISPEEAAPFFHHYLTNKEYRKRLDFSDSETKRIWKYNEAEVSKLVARMPMTMWGSAKGSMTRYEEGVFRLNFRVDLAHSEILYRWTKDICLYRLHVHFERKEQRSGE